jgi:DNA-binding GntR family transcriptional regulator
MRLVESAPYRGTRVRAVSDRETAEAYAVRAVLEQLAARLAAPRFKGDAAQLREILARIHAAAREGDLQGYTAANLALHRKIVASSGNGVLLQAWDSLSFEARMRVVVSRRPHEMVELAATHDPIVDALEAGDGELAGRLLLEHSQGFIAIALSTGADVDPEANDETDEEPG